MFNLVPCIAITALIWTQSPGKAARLPMSEYDIENLVLRGIRSREKFVVMIDAGSTGSTLMVFKLRVNNKEKVNSEKNIKPLKHKLGKVCSHDPQLFLFLVD